MGFVSMVDTVKLRRNRSERVDGKVIRLKRIEPTRRGKYPVLQVTIGEQIMQGLRWTHGDRLDLLVDPDMRRGMLVRRGDGRGKRVSARAGKTGVFRITLPEDQMRLVFNGTGQKVHEIRGDQMSQNLMTVEFKLP